VFVANVPSAASARSGLLSAASTLPDATDGIASPAGTDMPAHEHANESITRFLMNLIVAAD
jgi:hypothetical protein